MSSKRFRETKTLETINAVDGFIPLKRKITRKINKEIYIELKKNFFSNFLLCCFKLSTYSFSSSFRRVLITLKIPETIPKTKPVTVNL